MSFDESLRSITLEADSSIGKYTGVPGGAGSASPNGGKQYCFVKLTGALTVGLSVAAADVTIGVLQNKPQQAGGAATVAIRGVSNVVAGEVLAAGDGVVPDDEGRAVKVGIGETAVGIALKAGTEDALLPVLLRV